MSAAPPAADRPLVRTATSDEIDGWDAGTVDVAGGHVLQSAAWARHREATGWRAWHLVVDDRFVLALSRPWAFVPGAGAYVPRGPVAAGDDAATVARRTSLVADFLGEHGIDVVATDAEIEASTGYGRELRERGFRQIEEIQPSRHRMRVMTRDRDEAELLAACGKSTRQRIRAAEKAGILVRRFDRVAPADSTEGFAPPGGDLAAALDRFFDLELETARRRGFALGPRRLFLEWWQAAYEAGHLLYLEAATPEAPNAPLAGLVLYRHGHRLSTVQSGDRAEERRRHPGTLHLLRWRAIQLAVREARDEMDLGGVDIAGARHEPRPGDEMHGLYEHKRGFGAEWVELAGAHERVIRPARYAFGRVAGRVAAIGHRLRPAA